MNDKLISILLFNFIWANIFSQSCIETKLESTDLLNINNKDNYEVFFIEDKILLNRLFEKEDICSYLNENIYLYASHFFMSGYNSKTSSISHSIYLFTENFELLCWYAGSTKSISEKLQIPLLIQPNEDVEESDVNYIQTILKQFAENDVRKIEKEENEIKSGCNCLNYESIYHITPYKTKGYFFDLYYKKLFNGDFDEDLRKELEQYHKGLSE